ncbi:MAG: BACON domain-containing carbohydrate-binding protein [Bryobacteraceae bacterium]
MKTFRLAPVVVLMGLLPAEQAIANEVSYTLFNANGSVVSLPNGLPEPSVQVESTGVYNVTYQPPVATIGVPLVAARDAGANWCKLDSFSQTTVKVRCFDVTGQPVAIPFTLLLLPSNNDRGIVYAYADSPATATYFPTVRFNPYGNVEITKLSTGRHRVKFFGIAIDNVRSVDAVAVGSNNVRCHVELMSDSTLVVYVNCGTTSALFTDSAFTVALTLNSASARALGSFHSKFPSTSTPYGPITYTTDGQGNHTVVFSGLNLSQYSGNHAAIVTAYTTTLTPTTRYCRAGEAAFGNGPDVSIPVRCYNGAALSGAVDFSLLALPVELVRNGGFEAPVTGFSTLLPSNVGWTLVDGTPLVSSIEVTPVDGKQWVRLNNGGNAVIKQTVGTVPGAGYKISFAFANAPGLPSSSVRVKWGGQIAGTIVRTSTAFQRYTYDVYASGSTMDLQFESLGSADLLDDVRVTYNPSAPPPPLVTVTTSPAGQPVTVDGVPYTAPQNFYWSPGTQHSLSIASVINLNANSRLQFSQWTGPGFSNNNATVTITAPAVSGLYTANLTSQFRLTLASNPVAGGTVTASPAGTGGFYNAGTSVQVTASPNAGYAFFFFAGINSTANPASLTMNSATTATANFVGCTYSLSPTSATAPAGGGTGQVIVTRTAGCPWDVTSNASWLTSSVNGILVNYTVAPHTDTAPRTGTLTIAGIPFPVTQSGVCNFALNPASASMPAAGGQVSVTLTTGASCSWNATNGDVWITQVGGSNSYTGSATLTYAVAANTGTASRTGTTNLGRLSFSVTQAGTEPCNYTLNTNTANVPAAGGTASFTVTTGATCAWTADPGNSWTVRSGAGSYTGPATVSYAVGANSGGQRSVSFAVAGQTVTVTQAATDTSCTYTLTPSGTVTVQANGGVQHFTVATGPSCEWSVPGLPPYVTLLSPSTQTGSGSFDLNVAANAGQLRNFSLAIGDQSATVAQLGSPASQTSGLRFVALEPCRILETRSDYNFPLRTGEFGPPFLNAGTTRTLNPKQYPFCTIPASAKAYVLNVTLIPRPGGIVDYATVWPAGDPRPNVYTVRTPDGQIVANSQIVAAGANGAVSVYVSHNADALLDISGYFTDDAAVSNLVFYPVTPCRVVETRSDYRPAPGQFGPPSMASRQTRSVRFPLSTDCPGIPPAAAYSVTLTVVPPAVLPFLTTWQTGIPQPNVSSINSFVGRTLANNVIVPANALGSIDVYAYEATDFIMDINGYFAPDDGVKGQFYFPVTQCRLYDTMTANGPMIGNDSKRTISPLTSACVGIGQTARGYAINVTAVPNGSPMPFITVYPTGSPQPNASVLNAFQGQTVTNFAIVPSGTNGQIEFYAYRQTHAIVEINGYFGR